MIKDITQSVIAILVVGGAIVSAIMNLAGTEYITPIAGVVVGFYFKDGIALGKRLLSSKK
jgi:hypothetical protein